MTFLDDVDALLMRVSTGELNFAEATDALADLVTAERTRLSNERIAAANAAFERVETLTSKYDAVRLDAYFDNLADTLGDNPYAVEPGLLSPRDAAMWEALKDQGLIMRDRSVGGYHLTPTGWARLETIRMAREI